jgi:hypothetical protein
VSILLMCLDAFVYYYEDTNPKAIDRVARANLLSKAFGLTDLVGFTSAWAAHFALGVFRPAELVRFLRLAVDSIQPLNTEAMCRVTMTLGDVATYFGRFEVARLWYARAHAHAVDLGDHAYIAALSFNRPATAAFAARLHLELGQELSIDAHALRAGLRTSSNYERMAGVSALHGLQSVASSALAMYVEDFAEAKHQISASLADLKGESLSDNRLPLLADLALAHASTGEHQEATSVLDEALQSQWTGVEADEHLIACGSMLRAYARLNREAPATLLAAHSALAAEVRAKLSEMVAELEPAWAWQPEMTPRQGISSTQGPGR